jgi:tetratricopeptide (TPR) repeat protein
VWLENAIKGKEEDRYGLNLLLGMLHAAMGDRRAAMASYRASLEENPDFVPALNNLAWALAEEGELEEALEISTKGRGIDPENPFLADTHGWILFRSGNATGALPLIRQAVVDQPSNAEIRIHLVEILEAVGRPEEAAQQRAILDQQGEQSAGRDNSP